MDGMRLTVSAVMLITALLLLPGPATAGEACDRTTEIAEGIRIRVEQGNRIELEALPEPGEGYYKLAERFTGTRSNWRQVQLLNGTRSLIEGRWYRISLDLLTPPYRLAAVRSAFPRNRVEEGHYIHQVVCGRSGDEGERFEHIAHWYCVKGKGADELAGLVDQPVWDLRVGEEVAIPLDWLLPPLHSLAG